MRTLFASSALAVALLSSPALAHDLDCVGKPVPADVKRACCGAGDDLVLSPEAVRGQDGRGAWHVVIDGADHAVVDQNGAPIRLAPAFDGCYRVWYRRRHSSQPPFPSDDPHGGTGEEYHFFCFQGPLAT